MRHNSVFVDTTHGLINFPHWAIHGKIAETEMSEKPQPVIVVTALTIPTSTSKTITAFVDHPSERNATGILTPLGKITERARVLMSCSMSPKNHRRTAARVTN